MRDVVFGGKMRGVAGMGCCDSCRWADIHDGLRVVKVGGMTITQNGHSIDCNNAGDKSIDMRGDDIRCSGWEPRA